MRTGVALSHQTPGKEAFEQQGEIGGGFHRMPFQRRSRRWLAACISSGVLLRYQ